MHPVAARIDSKLRSILEEINDTEWKNPNSPNYDRQYAEDCLFHTIGPLTDNPRWAARWSSSSQPPPGFAPSGRAPQWTEHEIVIAFAGDPKLLFRTGGKDHPKSPAYGNRGGAPLYRLARQIARKYNRERDKSFIEEMYQNGSIELSRLMKPGNDQSRAGFISWVIRNVEGAMEGGTSGTGLEAIKAKGDVAKDTGLIGLQGLLKAKTPEDAKKVADQVKGKYATGKFHDKHADNPFGAYSSKIVQLANAYADALANGGDLGPIKQEIQALSDKIDQDQDMILGASTGIGQAVSTQDRVSSVGVNSMDKPNASGDGTMGDSIGDESSMETDMGEITPETIEYCLNLCLNYDLDKLIGNSPKYQQMAISFGLKPGDSMGGRFTPGEYRYLLRHIGPMAASYPGKGTMRSALNIPRDVKGWWTAGEDPEIEPIPNGGKWTSLWVRNGYQPMGNTEIARELTNECLEFAKLGINSVPDRMAKAQAGKEVISKVAVANMLAKARAKFGIIGRIHRTQVGLDENLARELRAAGITLMEDLDPIDRRLVNEAWDWISRKLTKAVMLENAERMERVTSPSRKPAPIIWSNR